ncbi:MAG: FkbM family methyltransferase, partial [Candidatus Acidiferrales bacterium]
CRVRNLCIGRSTGQVKFFLNKGRPNAFSLMPDSGAESVSVLCVSLNDLCSWEKIPRLDYLKIDAEGAEDLILEGGAASIERFRPIIQVEVTKARSRLPRGYRRFSVSKATNNVFIPSERMGAIETAQSLGWTESN